MNPPNNPTNHITLLLLTRNEEENLKKHFSWLTKCPAINEIVVIDDNSTDKTKETVMSFKNKSLSVKFFSRGLDHDFSAQRHFGVNKAKNNWILWLDADEQPEADLITFLQNFNFPPQANFSFRRKDIFLGYSLKHGETTSQFFLRLFDKNNGRFVGRVHEIWQSSLPIIATEYHLQHFSHLTLESFIKKIDFYTTIRARQLFDQHVPVNTLQIIFYPLGKFIDDYFFKLGLLDSTPGIILALGMSFHSFLVRAKLWHLYHP